MTTPEQDIELEQAIRIAYATALKHSHEGGTIRIHAGSEVVAYLKARIAAVEAAPLRHLFRPRLFGFTLIEDEDDPRGMSVHVVHFVT